MAASRAARPGWRTVFVLGVRRARAVHGLMPRAEYGYTRYGPTRVRSAILGGPANSDSRASPIAAAARLRAFHPI